jgi:hypothetical protein
MGSLTIKEFFQIFILRTATFYLASTRGVLFRMELSLYPALGKKLKAESTKNLKGAKNEL